MPDAPAEWWDRMAEAAASSGMAAELSSSGWRKPAGEQYPALGLLDRFVARGVPLTTASDAHHLDHVAHRADDLPRGAGVGGRRPCCRATGSAIPTRWPCRPRAGTGTGAVA